MDVLLATNPARFITAGEPAQTEACCVAPVKVGGAFTVTVTAAEVLEQPKASVVVTV